MNSMVPSTAALIITCWAEAVSAPRIITPAFALTCVFCSVFTRATIDPSPASGCDTYWKASAVPQMSRPPPVTVKVPFVYVALPDTPTVPMS